MSDKSILFYPIKKEGDKIPLPFATIIKILVEIVPFVNYASIVL